MHLPPRLHQVKKLIHRQWLNIQCTKDMTEDQDFQQSSCQSTSLINTCIITLTNECKFKSIYRALIAGTVSWG